MWDYEDEDMGEEALELIEYLRVSRRETALA